MFWNNNRVWKRMKNPVQSAANLGRRRAPRIKNQNHGCKGLHSNQAEDVHAAISPLAAPAQSAAPSKVISSLHSPGEFSTLRPQTMGHKAAPEAHAAPARAGHNQSCKLAKVPAMKMTLSPPPRTPFAAA